MIGRTAHGFIAVEPTPSPRELAWKSLEELRALMDADEAAGASLVPVERSTHRILVLRGEKVLLDSDLATLYGVETRALNQAVQRNIERFPSDFMFQLEEKELELLRSQTVTSKPGRGGRRTLPYAFTEQGVAMLSSVLRSGRAVQVNIAIMRAFVGLRKLISSNAPLAKRISELESKYDKNFKVVFQAIHDLLQERKKDEERPPIGFLTEAGITSTRKKAKR